MTENSQKGEEKHECYYCYRSFSTSFQRNEHVSYGHKASLEFHSSKLYKNILTRLREQNDTIALLRSELEDLKKTVTSVAAPLKPADSDLPSVYHLVDSEDPLKMSNESVK